MFYIKSISTVLIILIQNIYSYSLLAIVYINITFYIFTVILEHNGDESS
jgi:hypothetical protein